MPTHFPVSDVTGKMAESYLSCMYDLPYYKESDQQLVMDFIHQHPFAFIAGCAEDGSPAVTQVPVFIEERQGQLYLTGHIMRQTDHHRAFQINDRVVCVFTGHHTYVSATWYSNPHQASTWNYMSVHVKGRIQFLDEAALMKVLQQTSLHFEKGNTESSTVYHNLPEDYRNRLIKAIVAFEVAVEKIDHVFKLSQNRDKESYDHIINHLGKQNAEGQFIAEEMKKRKDRLFQDQ